MLIKNFGFPTLDSKPYFIKDAGIIRRDLIRNASLWKRLPKTRRRTKNIYLDRLTFQLEVDVSITVPGFVECIATIQSSIFKAWIFYSQREHEPVLFPLFALASDSGVIFDYFVFPEPYFIKILDGLTFKLEVDVSITVPGFVECIATIQSSIFKAWIFYSQREHEPVLFPLFALASDSGVVFDDFVFPEPGDLW